MNLWFPTSARSRGFTLLELLVVMIIIAVMVGMATIGLKRDYKDLLTEDANRLKALIMLGRDEALFQARSLGIRFSKDSYDFLIGGETQGSWVPMSDRQFRKRKLASGARLKILRNHAPVGLASTINKFSHNIKDAKFGEDGKSKGKAKKQPKPQVFLLSTGEVTPFTIELEIPSRARLEMSIDALGEVKIISNELY
jgi:general secretion pathway protein H